jgi:hypothetical protein
VIQAAISALKWGSGITGKRVVLFGKMPEAFEKARIEEVEKVFFSHKLFPLTRIPRCGI